jgi:hypothetical protein
MFKLKQNMLDITVHKVTFQVWKDKVIPEEWEITCTAYKKDQLQLNNHRGATLLNMGYKILSSILDEWLQLHANKIVGNYQCGF